MLAHLDTQPGTVPRQQSPELTGVWVVAAGLHAGNYFRKKNCTYWFYYYFSKNHYSRQVMKHVIVSLATLLCITTVSWGQSRKFTPSNTTYVFVDQSPSIDYKYHDGTARLIDGTVLTGRFQFNGGSIFKYRANSQATVQRIGFSMIDRMALVGADTTVTDRIDSTIFLRSGHQLYRQLAAGSTRILDRRFLVDEVPGQIGLRVYVEDDTGNVRKFKSLPKLNRWFYSFREQSGKKLPDAYLNKNEIVKAVAKLNTD